MVGGTLGNQESGRLVIAAARVAGQRPGPGRGHPASLLGRLGPLSARGADLAVGAPAGGGVPLPLPGQGLGHLVDHKLHDELLVFILVVPDERHGGAHHLGEAKGSSEARSGKGAREGDRGEGDRDQVPSVGEGHGCCQGNGGSAGEAAVLQ